MFLDLCTPETNLPSTAPGGQEGAVVHRPPSHASWDSVVALCHLLLLPLMASSAMFSLLPGRYSFCVKEEVLF